MSRFDQRRLGSYVHNLAYFSYLHRRINAHHTLYLYLKGIASKAFEARALDVERIDSRRYVDELKVTMTVGRESFALRGSLVGERYRESNKSRTGTIPSTPPIFQPSPIAWSKNPWAETWRVSLFRAHPVTSILITRICRSRRMQSNCGIGPAND